jgi:hypothetical protein
VLSVCVSVHFRALRQKAAVAIQQLYKPHI